MNIKHLLLLSTMGSIFQSANALSITEANGWKESAYIQWTNESQYSDYHVYCKKEGQSYEQIDAELVRNYGSYGRADVLGLPAGSYQMKVVPVKGTDEVAADAAECAAVQVVAHDRSGFGFSGSQTPGVYDATGKIKANTAILYITEANKDAVQMDVITDKKGNTTACKGIVEILLAYKKGFETHPLDIRVIGKVTNSGVITENADCKGDIVVDLGKNQSSPVTIEGVGNDATAYGWGIRLKNTYYCEVRNLGFFYCNSDEGDNVGLQQTNYYTWVHHNDMFYGAPGGDADQVKGDGALDCKKSGYITFSYNHFWDNGKCNLLGLSEGVYSYDSQSDYYITYHHNWYDHSDSRHPRCRYYNAHVYNNYYDGNSKYGVGSTLGSSVFVQNNYFRNCKFPMLTSMQGSDLYSTSDKRTTDNATFSKEAGGSIKACGNLMTGNYTFIPYGASEIYTSGKAEAATVRGINTKEDFDAYVVTDPTTQVPNSILSYLDGHYYSNFDTKSSMPSTKLDAADKVADIVTGSLGAGRMQHGDFAWKFSDSEDSSHDINKELQSAVINYKSTLVDLYTEPSGSAETTPDQPGEGGDAGETGGETGGDAVIPSESSMICHFTGRAPSNTVFYSFNSCNYSNSKGSATVNSNIYTDCLKMESATSVSFKTMATATLTLVFAEGETPSIQLNGSSISSSSTVSISGNVMTVQNLSSGTYTLTKDGSVNLFYIAVAYNEATTALQLIHNAEALNGTIYELNGHIVNRNELKRNHIYICNGHRYMLIE